MSRRTPLAQPRPRLNAGESGRSPEGTTMHAGSTGMHIARRAGSGAAQRSATTKN